MNAINQCPTTSLFVKRYLSWLDAVAIPAAEKAVARIQNRAWRDEDGNIIPHINLSRLSDDELRLLHLKTWLVVRALVTVQDAAISELEDRENEPEE